MPGFDGTGPRGQGPFTGGGRGYCAGYHVPGYMNSVPGRGGLGRGRGLGRGLGRRWAAQYASVPYSSGIAPKTEAEFLKEQARFMQEEISAVNQRIKELESAQKVEGNE